MSTGGISGRFRRVEDRYNRYDVVDLDGDKIGTVDVCTVDNTSRTIQVNAEKEVVKNSPSLGTSDEMSPEYESQVRSYYRL